MKEIQINTSILQQKIESLSSLKDECADVDTKMKKLSGSGETINIINSIDKEYESIKAELVSLIQNSIDFFENTMGSVVDADKTAADKLKQSSGVDITNMIVINGDGF